MKGLGHNPEISNISGLSGNYSAPQVSYDEANDMAEIIVESNGYVYFDVN